MVFSTLHTNDAPQAVTRLRDMGVEPFLITATLEAILAQRLVRKICRECKVAYEPGAEVLIELDLTPEDVQGKRFAYGRGCRTCNNTGYKGRTAIFEILRFSEPIRQMVIDGASLRPAARAGATRGHAHACASRACWPSSTA